MKKVFFQIIFAKKGIFTNNNDYPVLELFDGENTSVLNEKITNFGFSKSSFNLSKFSSDTILVKKTQEHKTIELIECILNLKNKTVGDIDLDEKVFCVKKFPDLIHQYIRYQNAKSRQGSHKTKTRSEVSGRSKKPFSQKGTGNARHASRKAPIFVGGGVAHGPKGQTKHKIRKLNKNEKKIGVASLLTKKLKLNDLLIFNDFSNNKLSNSFA